MSSVWETRYRLLVETLEKLVERLGDEQAHTPAELTEQTVRIVVGALTLLRQHHVNKRGQCRYCGWTRRSWRFWRRRPRCTVFRTLHFALGQPADVVLFLRTGSDLGLNEGKPGWAN